MRILHSYRWRRRFVITAILAAIGVPLGFLAAKSSVSVPAGEPTGLAPATDHFYVEPKHVPLDEAKRQRIRSTLAAFISTAVARKHVGRSWEWVGPALREGMTKREWSTGSIPVQPYPVSKRGLGTWDIVEFSYAKRVGLEVLLWPKRGSGVSPLAVDVDVVRGRKDRWLVDYWMPKRYRGGPAPAPTPARTRQAARKAAKHKEGGVTARTPAARATPAPNDQLGDPRARVAGIWWMLPIALLSLIVLIPAAIWLSSWRRNRRALAAYNRGRDRH